MGFFSGLKKAVKGIGKIAQKAAPAIAFIPGVGLPLAAGIGAAGGLISGGGISGAAQGAMGGAAGEALQSHFMGPGGGPGGPGGASGGGGAPGGAPVPQAGGFWQPGSQGFDIGDVGQIAQTALPLIGGAAAIGASGQASADSAEARRLAGNAVQITEEERMRALAAFEQNAPLRDAFRNIAMNFNDPTNPFARTLDQLGGVPGQGGTPLPLGTDTSGTPAGEVNTAVQNEMGNAAQGGLPGGGIGGIAGQAIELARQQHEQELQRQRERQQGSPVNVGSSAQEFLPQFRTA